MDLISILSEIRSGYNCMDEKEEPYYRALSEAIRLVSAEPEKRTEERTKTHACDCISRQAALDCVSNSLVAWEAYEAIEALPTAQPEIIYCKKCEHWARTYGDEQWGLGDCDVFDKHLVRCNGYCAWAERRTDENNNE